MLIRNEIEDDFEKESPEYGSPEKKQVIIFIFFQRINNNLPVLIFINRMRMKMMRFPKLLIMR